MRILKALQEIAATLAAINHTIKNQGDKMAEAVDDLKAAVARVGTSASNEIKAVADALAAAKQPDGSVSAADVEAAVTSLNAAADTLDAETASLAAPAPAPAPEPVAERPATGGEPVSQ